VTEHCGQLDYALNVAALIDFEISSTCGRGFHLNQNFAIINLWHVDLLNAKVFHAVKHGSLHFVFGQGTSLGHFCG
jgi:hypothetical protein